MREFNFEVGKSYCPHRSSVDKGLHVITVTKRSKRIVHFTLRYGDTTCEKKAQVKRCVYQLDDGEISVERIFYGIDNNPFGCEQCSAQDEREETIRNMVKSMRKYGLTDARTLKIAKEWYG